MRSKSHDPKIVREDEETEKIFSYNEDDSGGLFDVEDGIIISLNVPLPPHPMTTYSEAEVESFLQLVLLGGKVEILEYLDMIANKAKDFVYEVFGVDNFRSIFM